MFSPIQVSILSCRWALKLSWIVLVDTCFLYDRAALLMDLIQGIACFSEVTNCSIKLWSKFQDTLGSYKTEVSLSNPVRQPLLCPLDVSKLTFMNNKFCSIWWWWRHFLSNVHKGILFNSGWWHFQWILALKKAWPWRIKPVFILYVSLLASIDIRFFTDLLILIFHILITCTQNKITFSLLCFEIYKILSRFTGMHAPVGNTFTDIYVTGHNQAYTYYCCKDHHITCAHT